MRGRLEIGEVSTTWWPRGRRLLSEWQRERVSEGLCTRRDVHNARRGCAAVMPRKGDLRSSGTAGTSSVKPHARRSCIVMSLRACLLDGLLRQNIACSKEHLSAGPVFRQLLFFGSGSLDMPGKIGSIESSISRVTYGRGKALREHRRCT